LYRATTYVLFYVRTIKVLQRLTLPLYFYRKTGQVLIANSIHKRIESYVEFNPTKAFSKNTNWTFSVFNSLVLICAKSVTGEFNGKQAEYAPKTH